MRHLLIRLIDGYRFFFSPWIGNQCRFFPTCSVYAQEAIALHGSCAGVYLGASRILRCHPWCEGGLDPVPSRSPTLFRRVSKADTKPRTRGQ